MRSRSSSRSSAAAVRGPRQQRQELADCSWATIQIVVGAKVLPLGLFWVLFPSGTLDMRDLHLTFDRALWSSAFVSLALAIIV
jgi:hypothetical protein